MIAAPVSRVLAFAALVANRRPGACSDQLDRHQWRHSADHRAEDLCLVSSSLLRVLIVAASRLVTRKRGSFRTRVVRQVCEKRSRTSRFLTSAASSVLVAVAVCAGALYLQPSSAVAECVSDGAGTTNCTGDPATFPSGGAAASWPPAVSPPASWRQR
jgi:hypothetical protein